MEAQDYDARLGNVETQVVALATMVNTIGEDITELKDAVSSIATQFTAAQKFPWTVVLSFVGIFFIFVAAVGRPYVSDIDENHIKGTANMEKIIELKEEIAVHRWRLQSLEQ